jgi:hypothetical protein
MGAGAEIEEARLLDISWWELGTIAEAMGRARIVEYGKGNRKTTVMGCDGTTN